MENTRSHLGCSQLRVLAQTQVNVDRPQILFNLFLKNKKNTPRFFLAGDFGWRQATRRVNIKLVFSLFIIIVIRHKHHCHHLLQLYLCRVMNFGRFGLALVPIAIIIIYKSSQTPTPPPSSRTSPETLRLVLPHTQMR